MAFRHPQQVAFDDVDAAGIVYFAQVLDYCHRAWEGFLAAIGFPLHEILAAGARRGGESDGGRDLGRGAGPAAAAAVGPRFGAPIVHAEADYVRPLRHGDRFEVEVRVARLGQSSFEMGYALVGADGEPRATARLVHVTVEMGPGPFAKVAIPEAFRKALATHTE